MSEPSSFELVARKADGRENIVQTYARRADADAGRDLLIEMGADAYVRESDSSAADTKAAA